MWARRDSNTTCSVRVVAILKNSWQPFRFQPDSAPHCPISTPLTMFVLCVYCTKSEPASKTSNLARAERVVALDQIVRSTLVVILRNAPRTRSRTRVCKNQKFPYIFLASPPPTPPPRSGKRNGKEIFWFCFAMVDLHL